MLMPMTIAATASTPITENASPRMGSIRLALIDEHRGQEQPEPDERREKDYVAQRYDAAGEVLIAVDDSEAPCDIRHQRCVSAEEIGDQRIGCGGEEETNHHAKHESDHLIARQCGHGGAH